MTTTTLPLWLPNAITGVCTLLAGLGGATLTLLITGKRQRSERAEERTRDWRREQRLAIIEVLDAGHAWAGTQEGMFMALATVTNIVDLSKMEATDRHISALTRYSKALVAARLVVTDAELAPLVRALSEALDRTPDWGGPIMDSAKKHGRAEPEPIGKALGFVTANRRALSELEAKTLERFSL